MLPFIVNSCEFNFRFGDGINVKWAEVMHLPGEASCR